MTATSSLAERQAAWDDTCGSVAAFQQHGVDARGAYAYAGGPTSNYVQQAFVSHCFSWGRHYGSGTSTRTKLAPDWYESTRSVGGGRCNDPTLPCYNSPPSNKPYYLPTKLVTLFNPKPGHWASVQVYNLVRGSRIGEGPTQFNWDCSSPDANSHWTSRPELYCADDFFAALDQRSPTATATTPLGVARAWGRTDLAGTPRPTS